MNRTPDARLTFLEYTDPNTFTGPDSDPTLDSNDEIAFMTRDSGGLKAAGSTDPSGVIAGTGVAIKITDPLDANGIGYIYLFRQDGSLNPSAGKQYVNISLA